MAEILAFSRRRPRAPLPYAALAAGAFTAGAALAVGLTQGGSDRPEIVAAATPGSVIIGRASVVDGDTIDIGGKRIRLAGVDAPESGQTCTDGAGLDYACGREAAAELDAFLAASRPTRCSVTDTDRYGRAVSACVRADGADVQDFLVGEGWALDYAAYSGGAYAARQAAAEAANRGVWQGAFVPPWEWREGTRAAPTVEAEAPSAPPAGCSIKGNISSAGERIYHRPGQRHYDATVIDTGRGERWFCSEGEAVAAGWRAAQV